MKKISEKAEKLDNCLVSADSSIMDAMKAINSGGKKIALVVNEKRQLLGVITDGDVRRGLLNGTQMTASVTEIMCRNPVTAPKNSSKTRLLELMRGKEVQQIPLLVDDRVVHSVVAIDDIEASQQSYENAVVLMVGGLGSRLGELTANCPKPMLKVGEKPILESIIDNFKGHGFKNFYLSVNYRSDMIESYFGDGSKFEVNIQYIREKERMGTAGSLTLFRPTNDLPILVMNGDLLTHVNFSSFINFHIEKGFDASTCVRHYDHQIPFGVVDVDGIKITKIQEKPVKSYLVNAGIYALNQSAIQLVPQNSYFDMPSLLEKMLQTTNNVGVFPIHEYWVDIGRRDDFEQAELDYLKKSK